MELGGQLLPTLILICLCCRCVLCALCRLSLEVFLTLLREAGSRGPCLEGLAPVHPFLTGMRPHSWGGHLPHPLSSLVLLAGAGSMVPVLTQPGSRSQGLRAVPGSSASSPAWGRAARLQNRCTSLQRTEWFGLGPSPVSPWEGKRRWASGGAAGAPQAPSSQGLHSTGRSWVFLATLPVVVVHC